MLQHESKTLAHAACNLKRAAQLVEALQADNSNQDDVTDQKNRRIQELEGEVNLLRRNEKGTAQEMVILRGGLEQLDAIKSENESLKSQLESALAKNNALEATLRGKGAAIADLKRGNQTLVRDNFDLYKSVNDLEDKLKGERQAKEEANATVIKLTGEIERLKEELSRYQAARALFVQETEATSIVDTNPFTPRNVSSVNPGSSKNKKRKTSLVVNV